MNRTLLSLVAVVVGAGTVAAQNPSPPAVPAPPPQTTTAPVGDPACAIPTTPCPTDGQCLRGSAEFLLWFIERPSLKTPVILSNRNPAQDLAASFAAGSLSDPFAFSVLGPGGVGPSTFPGFRAMV